MKLSKVNRSLTQMVWDCSGNSVVAILSQFSKRLKMLMHVSEMLKSTKTTSRSPPQTGLEQTISGQRLLAETAISTNGAINIDLIFKQQEITLIKSMLNFLLCVSLCTCKKFMDLLPKEEIISSSSSTESVNIQGKQTRSQSAIGFNNNASKPPRPASAKSSQRPSSPTKGSTWQPDQSR